MKTFIGQCFDGKFWLSKQVFTDEATAKQWVAENPTAHRYITRMSA